jgi:hypothetical protein
MLIFENDRGQLYGFYTLNKNASTALNYLLSPYAVEIIETENIVRYCQSHNVEQVGVVLRDPVDRWKSGVVEYLSPEYNTCQINNITQEKINCRLDDLDAWWSYVTDQIYVDSHTAKQYEHPLREVQKYTQLKFFKLEDVNNPQKLLHQVLHWLATRTNVQITLDDQLLSSLRNLGKSHHRSVEDWKQPVFEYIDMHWTEQLEKRLKEYYSDDYQLIFKAL